MLPGSVGGTLIGEELLEGNQNPVLLVEGGPDFLAAWHLHLESRGAWLPLAFLGASHKLKESQLSKLATRHVRIFAHHDKTKVGIKAAERWQSQLQEHDCTVEIVRIGELQISQPNGQPATDLNDVLRADSVTVKAFVHRAIRPDVFSLSPPHEIR